MTAREIKRQFECRLANEPGQWKLIEATSAADAAETFAFDQDQRQAWMCAAGKGVLIVVVRSIDETAVSASYRVAGRVVPAYKASLIVPGEQVA